VPINNRNFPTTLSVGEKAQMAKIAQRVKSLPRGKWQGASTYRPGITTTLLGKLTSDMVYDEAEDESSWKASFQQWGWIEPSDDENEATALDYDPFDVWPWTMINRTKILSGTKVVVEFISGRWIVTDYEGCPIYLDDHDNDGIPNDEDVDYDP
jgi:hypothetical protein